jgi:hypothetical protein
MVFFKWINLLLHTYILFFFIVFVISLPTKLEIYYFQYNYILIYIIYGDKIRHGQRPKKCVRKRVTFRPLAST